MWRIVVQESGSFVYKAALPPLSIPRPPTTVPRNTSGRDKTQGNAAPRQRKKAAKPPQKRQKNWGEKLKMTHFGLYFLFLPRARVGNREVVTVAGGFWSTKRLFDSTEEKSGCIVSPDSLCWLLPYWPFGNLYRGPLAICALQQKMKYLSTGGLLSRVS